MSFAQISIRDEKYPLLDTFRISRGSKSEVHVLTVTITDENGIIGSGECVPYPRYGESVESTLQQCRQVTQQLGDRLHQQLLRDQYPAGAYRNAIDCALWDLQAKQSDRSVWQLANLPQPNQVLGACSLSIDTPERLAAAAYERRNFPLLKIKLNDQQVIESIERVCEACPDNRIFVDANEAWSPQSLEQYLPKLIALGVEMIEQPLPASADDALQEFVCDEMLLCADESFHSADDIERLANRYDVFNIKLDKTGGLTEAIEVAGRIESVGKKIMIGSMMATSLSLAPAMLLTYNASYVDLDSQLWITQDRQGGVAFIDGMLSAASQTLWG